MGNCVAGGGYLPVLCDKLLMTEGSELYLAGPALVKAAIGQQVDSEELGGAKMHSQISGTVDFYEESDGSCLKQLRKLIDLLPPWQPRAGSSGFELPAADPNDLLPHLPHRTERIQRPRSPELHHHPDSLIEYKSDYGQSLLCAYASIGGIKTGIIANQHVHTKSPKGELQIGGVTITTARQSPHFVMDCNQTQIPIVFFQDVQGFMVGRDSEQQGIIRSGENL